MLLNPAHDQFHLNYDPTPCAPEDLLLIIMGDAVLLKTAGECKALPSCGELVAFPLPSAPLHAFTQGAQRVFLGLPAERSPAPEGFAWEPVRIFRELDSQQDALFLILAYHLATWYTRHRYCGACSGAMHPAAEERALVCDHCGLSVYPQISPAVIVAIVDGDRLLLARNATGAFRHYSLIAGYVEVGESLEQAARREILEEVGLKVKHLRYMGSQPWGLSQSLMVGFCAALDGDATITLQASELADAQWFDAQSLPEHAGPASIAYELIERFRTGRLDTPLDDTQEERA